MARGRPKRQKKRNGCVNWILGGGLPVFNNELEFRCRPTRFNKKLEFRCRPTRFNKKLEFRCRPTRF